MRFTAILALAALGAAAFLGCGTREGDGDAAAVFSQRPRPSQQARADIARQLVVDWYECKRLVAPATQTRIMQHREQ